MKRIKMTFCPFLDEQVIRGNNGCVFRINAKKETMETIEYRINHESRIRVMEVAIKELTKKINRVGKAYYSNTIFERCFGAWFNKMVDTNVRKYYGNTKVFEEKFTDEFNEALLGFVPANEEEENQKHSGNLEAVDVVAIPVEPCATTEPEDQDQNHSGVLKTVEPDDSITVNIELKTGTATIIFKSKPTPEDLEFINHYLKYKLS